MSPPEDYREPEKYALDRPAVVRRIYHALIGVCVLLGLTDVANLVFHLFHHHAVFAIEDVPNFYGFYGLIGCIFLVLTARELRKVLMRDEDYYDNDVD